MQPGRPKRGYLTKCGSAPCVLARIGGGAVPGEVTDLRGRRRLGRSTERCPGATARSAGGLMLRFEPKVPAESRPSAAKSSIASLCDAAGYCGRLPVVAGAPRRTLGCRTSGDAPGSTFLRTLVRTSENGTTSQFPRTNCRKFMILHRNGAHGTSERPNVFSEAAPVLVVGPNRPTLGVFATCACHR